MTSSFLSNSSNTSPFLYQVPGLKARALLLKIPCTSAYKSTRFLAVKLPEVVIIMGVLEFLTTSTNAPVANFFSFLGFHSFLLAIVLLATVYAPKRSSKPSIANSIFLIMLRLILFILICLSNDEIITPSFEAMNVIVFSGSFSTPPKINILAINSLNDGGVENDPVILHY